MAKRFSELNDQMQKIATTLGTEHGEFGTYHNVDSQMLLEWQIKVKNLILKIGDENSEHYKAFIKHENPGGWMSGNASIFKNLKSVFLATKEDFEGGYLSSYKSMVQAEVFDLELEQAKELLQHSYFVAAAIIAGVVLETTLRELCNRAGIDAGKLDRMNADLAKSGVYSLIVQKQITALAGIRNSAAHGKNDFTKADVNNMISAIENFLALHIEDT